jgi:hypothetical protein
MKLYIRRVRPESTYPEPPEFGVRVVLREGDKIVRRTPAGEVSVVRVSDARTYALEDLTVDRPE